MRRFLRLYWLFLALAVGVWWSPLWRWEMSLLLVLLALYTYLLGSEPRKGVTPDVQQQDRPPQAAAGEAGGKGQGRPQGR